MCCRVATCKTFSSYFPQAKYKDLKKQPSNPQRGNNVHCRTWPICVTSEIASVLFWGSLEQRRDPQLVQWSYSAEATAVTGMSHRGKCHSMNAIQDAADKGHMCWADCEWTKAIKTKNIRDHVKRTTSRNLAERVWVIDPVTVAQLVRRTLSKHPGNSSKMHHTRDGIK